MTIEYRYDIINLSNKESEDLQIMMEQMTINDLKTGMHVVFRNGDEGIVFRDTTCGDLIVMLNGMHTKFNEWYEGVKHTMYSKFDIVKVYDIDTIHCGLMLTSVDGKENNEESSSVVRLIYSEEEPITRAEAEKLLGRKIVD